MFVSHNVVCTECSRCKENSICVKSSSAAMDWEEWSQGKNGGQNMMHLTHFK